jgi:hypothetical protein
MPVRHARLRTIGTVYTTLTYGQSITGITCRAATTCHTRSLDVDMFNVFNTNVRRGQTFVSGPTFGYLTNFAQSRILRLGTSFEF